MKYFREWGFGKVVAEGVNEMAGAGLPSGGTDYMKPNRVAPVMGSKLAYS